MKLGAGIEGGKWGGMEGYFHRQWSSDITIMCAWMFGSTI